MQPGGKNCVKYLMLVINFIFVVCGIALIIIGAITQRQDFMVFLNNKYTIAPIILIGVGCIFFILAFWGCCGAVRESHCLITTFGVLLFAIFLIEIAGGITAYVYLNEFEGILKEEMNSSIQNPQKSDVMQVWDNMQIKWHCCGVDSYKDYPIGGLPASCCPQDLDICTPVDAYIKGCFDMMANKVQDAIHMVGGITIGIVVVELIGVMVSWCLVSAFKKDYEEV